MNPLLFLTALVAVVSFPNSPSNTALEPGFNENVKIMLGPGSFDITFKNCGTTSTMLRLWVKPKGKPQTLETSPFAAGATRFFEGSKYDGVYLANFQ